MHLCIGYWFLLQPSLCAESKLWVQSFVWQYCPVETEVDQQAVVTCSSALLRCPRAENLKRFLYLRRTYRRIFIRRITYEWIALKPGRNQVLLKKTEKRGAKAYKEAGYVSKDWTGWISTTANTHYVYKESTRISIFASQWYPSRYELTISSSWKSQSNNKQHQNDMHRFAETCSSFGERYYSTSKPSSI